MGPAKPLLSLVIPAYNEVDSAREIADFYRASGTTYTDVDFELIVVDDGSTDGTREALRRSSPGRRRPGSLTLSRNFGSHAGISAGFAHAAGRCRAHAERRPAGTPRGDRRLHRASGRPAPTSSGACAPCAPSRRAWARSSPGSSRRSTSGIPTFRTIRAEGPSQILVARSVLDVLNRMPELNRNVLAMAAWIGFDQRRVYFEQLPRPLRRQQVDDEAQDEAGRRLVRRVLARPARMGRLGRLITLGATRRPLLIARLVLAFSPALGAAVAVLAGLILVVGGMIPVGDRRARRVRLARRRRREAASRLHRHIVTDP